MAPELPVPYGPLLLRNEETSSDTFEKGQARLDAAFDALFEQQATKDALIERQAGTDSIQDQSLDPTPRRQDFSLLAYYVFSEIPPDEKPADTVLKTMKDLPVGTPVEEIRRASDAFGLDFNFMKAVAKIESGFNPKQRTGSYIGLFQLSNNEFNQNGSGNITDPRDNALAGAYKFASEALLFEFGTGRKPTFSDLYLIYHKDGRGPHNTSAIRSASPGSPCVPPMKAKKRVSGGANWLSGAIRFPPSNMLGNRSTS